MNIFKKIIGGISLLCAFACSSENAEQERENLLKWLEFHIAQINQQFQADVESEKKGFYPHDGKTEYTSKGFIEYTLKEKTGSRLLVSQHDLITLSDIENTQAYKDLSSDVMSNQLRIELIELNIDGDEVESYEELDEYIDDTERYFIIRISGW